MKRLMIGSMAAAVVMAAAMARAEGEAPKTKPEKAPKAAKEQVAMETLTLFGKVSKEEVAKKGKDGAELKVTKYLLTEADGNQVVLPKPKAPKGQEPVNLDTFVDKQVKVVGKGKAMPAGAKKKTLLVVLESIEEAVAPAPAAEAPAAEAPAAEAPAAETK